MGGPVFALHFQRISAIGKLRGSDGQGGKRRLWASLASFNSTPNGTFVRTADIGGWPRERRLRLKTAAGHACGLTQLKPKKRARTIQRGPELET